MARKRDGLYRRQGDVFAFRYKDVNGLWREKYTGKTERDEAKKFRTDFLADIVNGTLPTHMADWNLEKAKAWWLDFRKPRIGKSTLGSSSMVPPEASNSHTG